MYTYIMGKTILGQSNQNMVGISKIMEYPLWVYRSHALHTFFTVISLTSLIPVGVYIDFKPKFMLNDRSYIVMAHFFPQYYSEIDTPPVLP